jgi:methionine synthase II (cobalamin-independent)
LKLKGIYTSTIGSFPLEDSIPNRNRCIKDLIDIGLDFPSYPQLIDMGKQFLDDLVQQNTSLIYENGRYKLNNRAILRNDSTPGLEPFFWTLRYLKEKKLDKKVSLKAPITGPFTLASYVEIKKGSFPFNTAISDLDIILQFAEIVNKCCKEVAKRAEVISIDEPVLGFIIGKGNIFSYKEIDIVNVYNKLKESCGNSIVGTHICGRLSQKLADLLLHTELDFLSHEFHDIPKNIKVYSPKKLANAEKILSVGCVSSKTTRVENVNEILHIMKRFKKYGDTVIFTPDCGFKGLSYNGEKHIESYKISIKKLENIVQAAKKI